ncbi:hypothetical protein ACA910_019553 [Epithemia clementina (nom. ined.)]
MDESLPVDSSFHFKPLLSAQESVDETNFSSSISSKLQTPQINHTSEEATDTIQTSRSVLTALSPNISNILQEDRKITNQQSVPISMNPDNTVVRYRIVPHQPHTIRSVYNCQLGRTWVMQPNRFPKETRIIERLPLPTNLSQRLVARTTVRTRSLRLVMVGDSLMWQMHNLWANAVKGAIYPIPLPPRPVVVPNVTGRFGLGKKPKNVNPTERSAYIVREGDHKILSTGVAVYYRINDFVSNRTDQSMPGAIPREKGEDWSSDDVHYLRNSYWRKQGRQSLGVANGAFTNTIHERNALMKALNSNNRNQQQKKESIGEFDVMLYRIPLAWIKAEDITEQRILESLETSHGAFGASRIILFTPHFMNNVRTQQDWNDLIRVRRLLSTVVDQWQPRSLSNGNNTGLKQVVLLDFGGYTDALLDENSKAVGFPHSGPYHQSPLARLSKECHAWPPSIRQSCAEWAVPGQCQCKRNMISVDGMHFCMNQIGGRLVAAVACILQCFYSSDENNDRESVAKTKLCAQSCNERFLTLGPMEAILDK